MTPPMPDDLLAKVRTQNGSIRLYSYDIYARYVLVSDVIDEITRLRAALAAKEKSE